VKNKENRPEKRLIIPAKNESLQNPLMVIERLTIHSCDFLPLNYARRVVGGAPPLKQRYFCNPW